MEQRLAKASRLVIVLLLLALLGRSKISAAEGVITATVTVNPLWVSVSAPSSVLVGESFQVEATIENRGEAKIEKAVATIILPDGLELVRPPKAERNLGAIPPHKHKTATWQVQAASESGYIIMVSASGEYAGVIITEDSTAAVTFTPEASPLWERFFGWVLRLFP